MNSIMPLIMRMMASQGRDGDTMLAHINPREAAMLRASGGRGTINPNTGLPEFAEGGFGGAASTGSSNTGGSPASDTMSGFQFDSPGAPQTSVGVPSGKVDMLDRLGSMAITGLTGAILGPIGSMISAANTASSVFGGPNIAQALADFRAGTKPTEISAMVANPLGGFDTLSMSSATPQVGAGLSQGSGPASGAAVNGQSVGPGAQTGQSSGLDAFVSSYLQPSPTPSTPPQPTPEEQALAARGFYTTPSASVTPAPSAIDPVLQSALLYARG